MSSRLHTSPHCVVLLAVGAAAAFAMGPAPAFSQQQTGAPAAAARLELATSSEVARAEYHKIIRETNNLRGDRARQHAMNALAADPNFGIARILMARAALSPELSAAVRAAETSRGLAAMANATAPEVLWGLYWREAVAGRVSSAQSVIRALAPMVPNDPDVQYAAHLAARTGTSVANAIKLDREFLARFPDYGAAYNQYAYSLFASGDRAAAYDAVQQYVRLAPEQPNPHDTWGDMLVIDGRLEEALAHSNGAIKVDSTWPQGYMKIGAIKLLTGTADEARGWFRRAGESTATVGQKIEAHNWIAVSYVYKRDAKAALREFSAVSDEVAAARLPAATGALVHQRMAVVEAMIGNRQNVAGHLAQAAQLASDTTPNQRVHAVIAYASIGEVALAQTIADAYTKATGANVATGHILNALVAVAAKDYARAEAALAQVAPLAPNDLLAQELRGEVLKAQGKRDEARAIKDQVMQRVVKLDSNPGFDMGKLIARLRAEKL